MFAGHFALGFAAKRAVPSISLGVLFFAAQFLDLLWPILLLLGIETVRIAPGITPVTPLDFVSYPYSHSLLMAIVWSALVGIACYLFFRRAAIAGICALLVFSHWILDFVTHRPDLPLSFGSTARVGLGLWYSLPATVAVEMTLFFAGVFLYARSTVARDRTGILAFAALVLFLLISYAAALLGPLPPNVPAIAWTGMSMWLLLLWAAWVDRHRKPAS